MTIKQYSELKHSIGVIGGAAEGLDFLNWQTAKNVVKKELEKVNALVDEIMGDGLTVECLDDVLFDRKGWTVTPSAKEIREHMNNLK